MISLTDQEYDSMLQEIERLRGYWARAVALHEQYDAEIQRLKALCAQAAEVLEILGYKGPVLAELRKAAQ